VDERTAFMSLTFWWELSKVLSWLIKCSLKWEAFHITGLATHLTSTTTLYSAGPPRPWRGMDELYREGKQLWEWSPWDSALVCMYALVPSSREGEWEGSFLPQELLALPPPPVSTSLATPVHLVILYLSEEHIASLFQKIYPWTQRFWKAWS
jgi:hypothetical protein